MSDDSEKGILALFMGALGTFIIGKAIDYALNSRVIQSQKLKRLSPNYLVDDFLVSHDFPHKIKKYRLNKTELANLQRLVNTVLEPLTSQFGRPRILGAGRPAAVGDFYTALRKRGFEPSKNSQHIPFAAVDVSWGDADKNKRIWEHIRLMRPVLQGIYYQGGNGRFHLSVYEPKRPNIKRLRLIKPPQ